MSNSPWSSTSRAPTSQSTSPQPPTPQPPTPQLPKQAPAAEPQAKTSSREQTTQSQTTQSQTTQSQTTQSQTEAKPLTGWVVSVFALAVLLGVAVHYLQRYYAPLLLLPMLWGAALGLIAKLLLELFPVDRAWLVRLTVAAVALTSVLVFHYLGFRSWQQHVGAEVELLQKKGAGLLDARELVDHPGHLGEFLLQRSRQGRTIWMGSWQTQLKGFWCWTLWAIEATLTVAVAVALLWSATRRPLDAVTRRWLVCTEQGTFQAEQLEQLVALSSPTDQHKPESLPTWSRQGSTDQPTLWEYQVWESLRSRPVALEYRQRTGQQFGRWHRLWVPSQQWSNQIRPLLSKESPDHPA